MSGLFAAGLILLALAAVADFAGNRFLRSWPLYLARRGGLGVPGRTGRIRPGRPPRPA